MKTLKLDDWLAERRKGVGGSDVAAITGHSPWKTAYMLYLEKAGQAPKQDMTENMYWGTVQEGIIADRWQHGIDGKKVNKYKIEHLSCRDGIVMFEGEKQHHLFSPDGIIKHPKHGQGGLEIKTAEVWKQGKWKDDIPDEYYLQVQWGMYVMGVEYFWIAAKIGNSKYFEYKIDRDNATIMHLKRLVDDFWQLIQTRTPPQVKGEDLEVINKTPVETIEPIEIDDESKVDKLIELKAQIKDLETTAKEIEAELKQAINGHTQATTGRYTINWGAYERSNFNSKAFAEEHPDLYKKYVDTEQYRRFTIKKEES